MYRYFLVQRRSCNLKHLPSRRAQGLYPAFLACWLGTDSNSTTSTSSPTWTTYSIVLIVAAQLGREHQEVQRCDDGRLARRVKEVPPALLVATALLGLSLPRTRGSLAD